MSATSGRPGVERWCAKAPEHREVLGLALDASVPARGGDREVPNQRTRQSYPIGVVVNRDADRFVDEGADFRDDTYAKHGREIPHQPDGMVFQIFDARTRPLLRSGARQPADHGRAGQHAGTAHRRRRLRARGWRARRLLRLKPPRTTLSSPRVSRTAPIGAAGAPTGTRPVSPYDGS